MKATEIPIVFNPYVFLQTLFWAFLPQSGGLRLRILSFTVGGAGAVGAGAGRGVWKKHLRDTAPPRTPSATFWGKNSKKNQPFFFHLSINPMVFRTAPRREGGVIGVGGANMPRGAFWGSQHFPPTATTAP